MTLEARQVRKSYGDNLVLDDLSLEIRNGEILGLIGPNGSGKTTLFDILTGFVRPDAGSVHLDGEEITDLPPHRRVERGVYRSYQDVQVFDGISVAENLRLGAQPKRLDANLTTIARGARGQSSDLGAELREWLAVGGLEDQASIPARNLSYGQRKILMLLSALSLTPRPAYLLLDEPIAGINPGLFETFFELVELGTDEGHTFLLIEHDPDLIMDLCDRMAALVGGDICAIGAPVDVIKDETVVESYLG